MVIHASEQQWAELMSAFKRADDWRADQMPDEAAALRVMHEAYRRLQELGWREAIYAPVGKLVDVIEAGSTGIHQADKDELGRFWVFDNGDVWPSRPILFRLTHQSQAAQEAKG